MYVQISVYPCCSIKSDDSIYVLRWYSCFLFNVHNLHAHFVCKASKAMFVEASLH